MTRRKIPAQAGSGSPEVGEPVYLAVGYLRRTHGVRGEMLMALHTDFPDRLRPGMTVYVGKGHRPMTIASRRPHGQGLLIAFEGLTVREQAAAFRNQWVYVAAADRPSLPPGEYYHHQLLGLQVVDNEGRDLGRLTAILETGANDVYVVTRPEGGELLLPAIPPVILDVDLPRGRMRVRLLDGLM